MKKPAPTEHHILLESSARNAAASWGTCLMMGRSRHSSGTALIRERWSLRRIINRKTETFINKPKLYIYITLVNPMIPLANKIKKTSHREVARAQDMIVEELYAVFNDAVLHGGTAIWRCYGANRFSEDIDVYLPRNIQKIEELFVDFVKKGFEIAKKKIGENSIYANLRFNRIDVRFEAVFKKAVGSLKEYEKIDGNVITVYTLTPEEFIQEKVAAYTKRRKIRDLYDIFFLMRHVGDKEKIKPELKKLLTQFEEPIDRDDLKVIILEGLVPTVEKMREYLMTMTR